MKTLNNGIYVPCGWRKVWIMWDLDNGHSWGANDAGKGYIWVFRTRKEAREHKKEQNKRKFGARLSMPFKITYKTKQFID